MNYDLKENEVPLYRNEVVSAEQLQTYLTELETYRDRLMQENNERVVSANLPEVIVSPKIAPEQEEPFLTTEDGEEGVFTVMHQNPDGNCFATFLIWTENKQEGSYDLLFFGGPMQVLPAQEMKPSGRTTYGEESFRLINVSTSQGIIRVYLPLEPVPPCLPSEESLQEENPSWWLPQEGEGEEEEEEEEEYEYPYEEGLGWPEEGELVNTLAVLEELQEEGPQVLMNLNLRQLAHVLNDLALLLDEGERVRDPGVYTLAEAIEKLSEP